MNNELQEKANALLDKILEATSMGIDKIPAVVQDLMQEYLLYYSIGIMYKVILGLLLLVLGVYGIIKLMRLYKEDNEDLYALLIIGFTLLAIPGLLLLIFNLPSLFEIYLAPNVYLIETLRR